MPKGTVGTLFAETAPLSNPSSVRSVVRTTLKSLTRKAYCLVEVLFFRDNWLFAAVAFLLSRVSLMGELAPFGLAFFAAVAQVAEKRVWVTSFWALAGVLSIGRYMEAGLYLFVMLLYFRLSDKFGSVERRLKLLPLFVFAAVVLGGSLLALWRDATLYQLLIVIFNALMCMMLAYVFMVGVRLLITRSDERQINPEMLMCLVLIIAVSIAGLNNITVAGLSLRNIAGMFAVMILALGGGAGLGAAIGVVTGLVIGLCDDNATTMISLFAIAGMLGGSFQSLGKFAVVLGFMLGGVITVLHFGNSMELTQVLAEGAVAAAAFGAVPLKWLTGWVVVFREQQKEQAAIQNFHDTKVKLSSISEIFANIAAVSGKVSVDAGVKTRETEIARLLSAVGEQVCGPCRRRTYCWEENYAATYQGMLDALAQAGRAKLIAANLPGQLAGNCMHCRELAEIINVVDQQNRAHSFWQKELAATRKTVAEQMIAVSGIIDGLAGTLSQEPTVDKGLVEKIEEKAALAGCLIGKVKVNLRGGIPSVEVRKATCGGTRECVNTILPLLVELLDRKLTLHSECGEACADKKCRLFFQVVGQYKLQTGVASVAKEPQGVCGDTSAVLTAGKGKFALVISDGMGSGSRAASESSAAVAYLGKMLKTGFAVDVAVKTVNNTLMLREPDENFATLDIAVVDTLIGEAEFLKVGAAPSYIKRGHEVATIKSANLPIGILNQLEVESIKCFLASGDVIVMVSDGIIDIPSARVEREPWLVNFLRRADGAYPQDMADSILQEAIKLAGRNIRDDMTVLVARITEAPGLYQ